MKVTCPKCRDTYDVPDGQGINQSVCPFCENVNPILPQPSATTSTTKSRPKHPLAEPFWIMAICAMLITFIIIAAIVCSINAEIEVNKYLTTKSDEFFNTQNSINHSMTNLMGNLVKGFMPK